MVLMESAFYCLASLPTGYLLGIFAYRGIEHHLGNLFYALCGIGSVALVVSVPYSVGMIICAVCVILLSGLRAAVRTSRIPPIAILRRTSDITLRRDARTDADVYGGKAARGVERWLAEKSYRRFRRRNRPILLMLAVTFMLCFVLNGFRQYSAEVMELRNSGLTYNYREDLYGDDKEMLDELAGKLVQLSEESLVTVKEALFILREPYPVSESGEAMLSDSAMFPDVSLLCVEEAEFEGICGELGIAETQDKVWGIFLDAGREHPYDVKTGDTVWLYDSPWAEDGGDGIALHIAGVYDRAPQYTGTTQSTRMQVLVPETVFDALETRRTGMDAEPGAHHLSLRGNLADCTAFEKSAESLTNEFPEIFCSISNYEEQLRKEQAGNDSFTFLCAALIAIFVFICICGNVTVSWSADKSREQEYTTLLSVGMMTVQLRKMRLYELLRNVRYALVPGILAGMLSYQLIYGTYASEYKIAWQFPWLGFLLGMAALLVSEGTAELVLHISFKNNW
jgi:hypothetical protein